MTGVVLGLGCNLGKREIMLFRAVMALPLTEVRCSAVYETPALLPEGATMGWNLPFLNMAVYGQTGLAPEALLAELKRIEKELGRKDRGHWGPREIDIDILVMEGVEMATESLTIPHAQLLKRDFALIPLAELMPGWMFGPVRADAIAKELFSNNSMIKTSFKP